jgi:hypothetical protein
VHFVVVEDPGGVGVVAIAFEQPAREREVQRCGGVFTRMDRAVDEELGLAARQALVVELQHEDVEASQARTLLPGVAHVDPGCEIGIGGGEALRRGIGFFHGFVAAVVGNRLDANLACTRGHGLVFALLGLQGQQVHLVKKVAPLGNELVGPRQAKARGLKARHVSGVQLHHQVALVVVALEQRVVKADGRAAQLRAVRGEHFEHVVGRQLGLNVLLHLHMVVLVAAMREGLSADQCEAGCDDGNELVVHGTPPCC